MEGHHHHRHQHLQQHPVSINVESDRFPQWSVQETREFLTIRAELDQSFMETKRNKLLWEIISTKMKEKGYNRSAEQCKCKWKNLVTRYKGCGTIEAEAVRQQFPFYDELQSIFTARMQSILCSESETGGATRKKAVASAAEMSSEEEDMEENELDNKFSVHRKKKKAKTGTAAAGTSTSGSNNNSNSNNIKEILEDFMRQQLQMEMQWREALEVRENERRLKEMEWRQAMEALENERIMMERRWREREEQRRMREEARAEKRDALITALLNKLRREDQM